MNNKLKRHIWAFFYLAAIVVFSLIYAFIGKDDFSYKGDLVFFDWVYFSVITITTLGYGDISPLSTLAKTLVSIEAILGLFLLGMFLNNEAQNAIEKTNNKHAQNLLNRAFQMLEFMEIYFVAALGEESNQNTPLIDRFRELSEKLKYQPEKFNFTDYILDNIYWGARHAVNDFRVLAFEAKALSDEAASYINPIITNLESIEGDPIDEVAPQHRKQGPESMQHKVHVVFRNAVILNKIKT